MKGFSRGIGLAAAVLTLALAAPAGAQENLDSGKTGAQLFAANCAACHKSPQALSKSGGLFGLSGFLREHYTSSRETAATIATYLESLSPAPGKRTGATKRSAKGDQKKGDEKKDKPKPGEEKSDKSGKTAKPAETKTSGPKTSEPKTEPKIEPKIEPKSKAKRESKTTEPKSDEAKPKEPKAKDAKSSAPKPAAKPDKPEKSD
jgi:outer membrane biosynthesis protein TonB